MGCYSESVIIRILLKQNFRMKWFDSFILSDAKLPLRKLRLLG